MSKKKQSISDTVNEIILSGLRPERKIAALRSILDLLSDEIRRLEAHGTGIDGIVNSQLDGGPDAVAAKIKHYQRLTESIKERIDDIKELHASEGTAESRSVLPDGGISLESIQTQIDELEEEERRYRSRIDDLMYGSTPAGAQSLGGMANATKRLKQMRSEHKHLLRRLESLYNLRDGLAQSSASDQSTAEADPGLDFEPYRFNGARAELRYLLNSIFERWIDDLHSKAEFFRTVAPLFRDSIGVISDSDVENMLKKVNDFPANAKDIDDALDEAKDKRFEDL